MSFSWRIFSSQAIAGVADINGTITPDTTLVITGTSVCSRTHSAAGLNILIATVTASP